MENQKENLFSEPHKRGLVKSPLQESSKANVVLAEIQPDLGPLTTPTKPKEVSQGEPWTPTANLKMLISAVSPEIRSRDQKRGLSDNRSGLPEARDCLHEHLSGDEFEKSQPSRKEKSLGLLCHKFLARYPKYPNPAVNNDICLDEVAEELNVERRRIYDIVNVLESLHMVSRLAKNRYTWHGRHNLTKTLGTLKSVGEENKYAEQIMMIKRKEHEQEFDFIKSCGLEDHVIKGDHVIKSTAGQNGHSDMCFVELPGVEFRAASANSRKDKSLRVMSQKFVMLFLVSTPQIVSLEIAAKILIGEDHVEDLDKSKFKTKIRRLYDIANVLSSLDLIKKVHVTEERGRKPAFKWTGPEISPNNSGSSPVMPLTASLEAEQSAKENCAKNLFSPPPAVSAPPANPPTTGAPPGPGPTPTPPPAVPSTAPGPPPPSTPSSGVSTTPPQTGGPPPPPAGGAGPGPKQGPGPGGPKGGKMPGGPKPGGGPGMGAPGGHPKPPHRGGGEPRGGRQHHAPYHQQHHQGPPPGGPGPRTEEKISDSEGFKANLSLLRRPGEKTYTQRCRLFVGNLPADITEDEFKRLFAKYGEPGEVFINKGKGFGFIKLESRALAEIAKAELDDTPMRGRQLRVRFATHAAALSVRNLSPYVSNELLEEAFSQFGPIERAVVIVDDRGRSTGKGIVEFASKPAARKAFERCSEGVFLLTTTPRPVIVEPLEQLDDEDGLPEKLAQKNPMYQKERETPPRFAQHGTFEYEYSQRWKSLDEMEKQQREQVEKNMKDAKDKLESEMEDAYHEHQANLLRQDLMRRQEELRRMEELHSQEMQKRKEMQLRQEEERRRREEEMMIRQREMEEQMRRQREESYSRMGYMDPRERDMRMGGGGTMNMGDPYGSGGQKFPPLGGGGGIGYEANPGVPPATMSGSMMGSDMRTERFGQGGAGPVGGQGPRGMGPGTPAGYGRGREEYEGPNKKPRF